MKRFIPFLLILFFTTPLLLGQIVVLDDFETGAGHFNVQTGYSGSTAGIVSTTPTIDSTTAAFGTKSLRIVLIDDPASTSNWAVRFLSGIGDPNNNVNMAPNGWTGYWLKTNRPWLRTAPCIDAPGTAEVGDTTDVIGDNQWHVYQWNLGQDGQPMWKGWVTGNDTISDDPTPTYDAIWFFAPDGSDTTVVWLDHVSWNPTGNIPVELASFTAVTQYNQVDLRWITATEINNAGFEVQRKAENGAFEKIAYVEGKGTTTEITPYTYTDVVDQAGVYYYRLKQVDYDGTYEYSHLVKVNVTSVPNTYSLEQNFPNPFNPATVINYTIAEAGMVTLSVYNTIGEKVGELVNQVQQAGPHQVEFDASSLASGTYVYTLNINGYTITKKMLLMK